ncbi:MAG: diguanylate cyclase [Campylobacterales bacterium]|nr:diguanylate cyclase [Campylobacterales bacterium]
MVDYNLHLETMLGSQRERLIGFSMFEQVRDERVLEALRLALTQGFGTMEGHYTSVTGTQTPYISALFVGIRNDSGVIEGGIGIVQDLSREHAAALALERSEKLLKESQRIARIGSWELQFATGALVWTDEVYVLLGLDPDQFEPSYALFLECVAPDDRLAVQRAFERAVEEHIAYDVVHRIVKEAQTRYLYERGCIEYADDGTPVRAVGTVHDITDEYDLARKVERFTLYDTLTGLPNRHHFEQKLEECLRELKHEEASFMAICFVDLDNFKYINDAYGHRVGDEILQETACRLTQQVEGHGWVARFGGDEFVVVLETFESPSEVASFCTSMAQSMTAALGIGNEVYQISVSMGIALYPEDSYEVSELMKFADAAMHRAKASGKTDTLFIPTT